MYINRLIDTELMSWKNSTSHKPLLLRGARQVGKSSSVRHLGESFKYFIEVNFEKQPELKKLFDEVSDAREIANRLGLLYGIPVVPGETLLFFDEIQACLSAIKSLWFFKEDFPDLHVVAAGSLLEFALKELTSFGVGRIRSLFMYPLSFDEFLGAVGKSAWVDEKKKASAVSPLFDALHEEIVQQFRTFLMVGGMPASVKVWTETHDYLQCADEQEDIQQTYYDDFVKYAGRVDVRLIRNTLTAVALQIGKKFTYSKVEGCYRAEDVKKALSILCDAGIIQRVSHTSANGLPLGAEVNDKFRKYIYLDSGLLLRILDIDLGGCKDLTELIISGTAEDLVNKGGLAELLTGWEIIKYSSPRSKHELYYWENTSQGTTSEVDYIMVRNLKILPLEVKAGTSGKMKSLRLFMQKKKIQQALRCSLENFGKLEVKDSEDGSDMVREIIINPLYAISTFIK